MAACVFSIHVNSVNKAFWWYDILIF